MSCARRRTRPEFANIWIRVLFRLVGSLASSRLVCCAILSRIGAVKDSSLQRTLSPPASYSFSVTSSFAFVRLRISLARTLVEIDFPLLMQIRVVARKPSLSPPLRECTLARLDIQKRKGWGGFGARKVDALRGVGKSLENCENFHRPSRRTRTFKVILFKETSKLWLLSPLPISNGARYINSAPWNIYCFSFFFAEVRESSWNYWIFTRNDCPVKSARQGSPNYLLT